MLTSKQQAVLAYVQAHHRQHGHHPSLREIQGHFGFASPFAVTRHLQALQKKGVLERIAGKARAFIEPGRKPHAAILEIPLYGVIPAGSPTAAEQQPDSYITLDPINILGRSVRSADHLFALRVRGDSIRSIPSGSTATIVRSNLTNVSLVASPNCFASLNHSFRSSFRVASRTPEPSERSNNP